MRFAANLGHLFTELPFMERFPAAKDAGFDAVEIPYPYEASATETRTALIMNGLEMVMMCAPPPNWTGGPRGLAAMPGLEERFRRDFGRALRFADVLKSRHVVLLAGPAEGAAARDTFVANLAWAAAEAPGRSLLIEPLAPSEAPGYFLSSFDLAAQIIDAVGAPNLGLLFDLWQADQITGDALAAWAAHGRLARHVQIAGLPDGHEPPGDFDLAGFLARIAGDGYAGFIAAEYLPKQDTRTGLGWLEGLTARA